MGPVLAERRQHLGLSQAMLASRAHISRATVDALENGRLRELGFTKLTRVLAVLGMELTLREIVSRHPTLEELRQEQGSDQDLDRRS